MIILFIFGTSIIFIATRNIFERKGNQVISNLKISDISEKIHIINNSGWIAFRNAGNCTGNGTFSEPYVIEDLVINAGGVGSCIWIENSDVYFIIQFCSLLHSDIHWNEAGIKLRNVTNGILINNICSSNFFGISIWESDNNVIQGNDVKFNHDYGIFLSYSNNNTILANTVYLNGWTGIDLENCGNNTISENILNMNQVVGIQLEDCDNNTVSKNAIKNSNLGIILTYSNNNTIFLNDASNIDFDGIALAHSDNNTISRNTANYNDCGIDLSDSDNNTISGNTANYNTDGIILERSNYNKISGNNLIGNVNCIYESDCRGNFFENNNCGEEGRIIPGYYLFILLGTISIVAMIIKKNLKKK